MRKRVIQSTDQHKKKQKKQSATEDEIAVTKERATILIYKDRDTDPLIDLRLKRFHANVTDSKMTTILDTCHQHLRLPCFIASVCTIWFRNGLDTCYYQTNGARGFKTHDSFPFISTRTLGPQSLLELVKDLIAL